MKKHTQTHTKMATDKIKVAVRVRPFNRRGELQLHTGYYFVSAINNTLHKKKVFPENLIKKP